MPADNEFGFAAFIGVVAKSQISGLKRDKCFKEASFNSIFAGLAGTAVGFIYSNNLKKAYIVGLGGILVGFSVTGMYCTATRQPDLSTNIQTADSNTAET